MTANPSIERTSTSWPFQPAQVFSAWRGQPAPAAHIKARAASGLTSRSTRTLLGGAARRPSSRRLALFVRRHMRNETKRHPGDTGLVRTVLRMVWNEPSAVFVGVAGLLLLFVWAFVPMPSRDELTEVSGTLLSYSVEPDQSWFAQHLSRRSAKTYVLFSIAGHSGRFWNESVNPANVNTIFPHIGVTLRFYYSSRKSSGRVNGDGERSWGLTVDGSEIESVDQALLDNAFPVRYVFPPLGAVSLIFAIYVLRKANHPGAPAQHAMTTCPYCGRPAISLWQKSRLNLTSVVPCQNCGKLVGVPWWDFLMILPALLTIVFRHWLALPAIVPFVILGLNFFLYVIIHLYVVPLVRRGAA